MSQAGSNNRGNDCVNKQLIQPLRIGGFKFEHFVHDLVAQRKTQCEHEAIPADRNRTNTKELRTNIPVYGQ